MASTISYGITVLGVILTALAVTLDLGAMTTLFGMLLIVAGVVKIGMVAIWKSFFAMPLPVPSRPADKPGDSRGAGELHEV